MHNSDIGTGLLLGGGVSYLAPEHGWSADGITEMDVVLVDGRKVTVNANNSYADLFRALKGGGNRFGIVTRFEVEPIHVGKRSDKNWYGGVIRVSQPSIEGSFIEHIPYRIDAAVYRVLIFLFDSIPNLPLKH
jgi:hypothetical protein